MIQILSKESTKLCPVPKDTATYVAGLENVCIALASVLVDGKHIMTPPHFMAAIHELIPGASPNINAVLLSQYETYGAGK